MIHHKSWLLITGNGERKKLFPYFQAAYKLLFSIQPPPSSTSFSCFETWSSCTFTPNNLSPTPHPFAIQHLSCHSVRSTLKMDTRAMFCDSAISFIWPCNFSKEASQDAQYLQKLPKKPVHSISANILDFLKSWERRGKEKEKKKRCKKHINTTSASTCRKVSFNLKAANWKNCHYFNNLVS